MSDRKDNPGQEDDITKEMGLSKDLSKEKGLPEEIGELFLEGNPFHFLARLGVDIATAKRTIKSYNQAEKQINTLELSTKISPKESKEVKAFIETLEELKLFNVAYDKNDDHQRDNQIATPLDHTFLLLLDKDEIIRNANKMQEKFHQKMQDDDPHLAAIRKGVTLKKTNTEDRKQTIPSEEQNLVSILSKAMMTRRKKSRYDDNDTNDDENQFDESISTDKPQKQQANHPKKQQVESPRVESPRVESPRAKPPRAEPQRAEPQRAEPQRAEPQRAEPPRAEPQRAEPQRAEPPRAEQQRRAKPQRVEPPMAARHLSHARAPDIDNSKEIWENIKVSISQLDVNKVTGVANKHAIRQLKNFVDEKDKINDHDSRGKEMRLRAFDETAHRILNDLKTIKDPSVRDVIQALQIKNTPEKPGSRPRRG